MRKWIGITLTAGLVLVASPAGAREITVGNCAHGRLATTHHWDPVTGDTTVVICNPADPSWG